MAVAGAARLSEVLVRTLHAHAARTLQTLCIRCANTVRLLCYSALTLHRPACTLHSLCTRCLHSARPLHAPCAHCACALHALAHSAHTPRTIRMHSACVALGLRCALLHGSEADTATSSLRGSEVEFSCTEQTQSSHSSDCPQRIHFICRQFCFIADADALSQALVPHQRQGSSHFSAGRCS